MLQSSAATNNNAVWCLAANQAETCIAVSISYVLMSQLRIKGHNVFMPLLEVLFLHVQCVSLILPSCFSVCRCIVLELQIRLKHSVNL